MSRQPLSLVGKKFGLLAVLRRAGHINSNAAWLCRCECGEEVVVRGDRLKAGSKKSCAINGHRFTAPRKTRTPGLAGLYASEYRSWTDMKTRCYNKNTRAYKYYGGRGIKMCERWKKFANFIADLGPKPTLKHTIERNDVNGNYEPGNCQWVTKQEQQRNKRDTIYVDYDGERVRLVDLIERLGMTSSVVRARLKDGWPVEQALTIPVKHYIEVRKIPDGKEVLKWGRRKYLVDTP